MNSASAIAPHLRRMFLTGWDMSVGDPKLLFGELRVLGQRAETDMFRVTGGVNTYKGLFFSTGILAGALGATQCQGSGEMEEVVKLCADLGKCSLIDFTAGTDHTNGMRCYWEYHLAGIRGEAAAGFPSVVNIGVPSLRRCHRMGLSENDAAVWTLLELIAGVPDTNMIRRGGIERAAACREEIRKIMTDMKPEKLLDKAADLDRAFIAENLSPGGCADLLCLSLMMNDLWPDSCVIP